MKVTVVVDGVYITGLADGSFVEASKNEDSFSTTVGGHGEVSVAENVNPLGTITIRVKQTSPQLKTLNAIAAAGQTVSIWVYSVNDPEEKAGGARARIKRQATLNFNTEIQTREFQFEVFDYVQE